MVGPLSRMENEQVTCYPRVMNSFKSPFRIIAFILNSLRIS
jgi:hypothetical protein